jgi:hypothetical protein
MKTILVVPDTQARPGAPTDHLGWIGRYAVDRYAGQDDIIIVHLGDAWDMPSLSSYDRKGSKAMEGRRVLEDIRAGNEAFRVLNQPFNAYNGQRKRHGRSLWTPERHLLRGNHENRLIRAIEENPQLDGLLSDDLFESPGWQVHPYQEVLNIEGISFSHYFVKNENGMPVSGMIETRIKGIGTSFVQGHQQGLKVGTLETVAGRRRGVVAGSCYLTSEGYRGPQATNEWRGILVLHQVHDGDFDLMEVSLDYLCRRYEGTDLKTYMLAKYGVEWVVT